MQLHPTRNAVDLTLVGLLLVAVGVVLGQVAIIAWGGAIIVGLQIARAVTLLSVARVRTAGFEMLWTRPDRSVRAAVGQSLELLAEVRNRDSRAARYVELRVLHSPFLEVALEPMFGEVPAGGRLAVTVKVQASRVGRHGIYGLSLEVQGSPGLYEVPLTFSNPLGLEVLPGAYAAFTRTARGGRSHQQSEVGHPGKRRGGQDELRELRDYQSGDPFKRIAWRASARRGKMVVREYDLEERDVVWIFLDASTELWAGVAGDAPLDHAIERCGWLIEHHTSKGDRVGLGILAARQLAWFPPNKGAAHAAHLLEAAAFATGTYSGDRSAFDEAEVAARVLEHMRPLEPGLAEHLHASEIDRIARRASLALRRAPFKCPAPHAASPREQSLRHYLASFGIPSPARLEPDRPKSDSVLAQALKQVTNGKPRPSLIYICSPVPDPRQQAELLTSLKSLPRRRCELRWVPTRLQDGLDQADEDIASAVRYAIELRAEVARQSGEQRLRSIGVKLEPLEARSPRSETHTLTTNEATGA